MKIADVLPELLPWFCIIGCGLLIVWILNLRANERYGKGVHTLRIYHMNEEPTVHKSTDIGELRALAEEVMTQRRVTGLDYHYANGTQEHWSKS